MFLWYISFVKFRNLSDRAIGVTRDRVDADSTFEVVHNSAIFASILGSHFYYIIVKKITVYCVIIKLKLLYFLFDAVLHYCICSLGRLQLLFRLFSYYKLAFQSQLTKTINFCLTNYTNLNLHNGFYRVR